MINRRALVRGRGSLKQGRLKGESASRIPHSGIASKRKCAAFYQSMVWERSTIVSIPPFLSQLLHRVTVSPTVRCFSLALDLRPGWLERVYP